ncbi:MAG: tRNA-dihydrouridine synthase DusB [uncultured Frankineae bacterium]|uniref:tRNA-dihydrouridine synthase n=1 Tax=uncultured Frankineae bacterium TaxID=437475 RepID=A0A6J4KDB2_9ACTN|nr:MAG: tRNA-dihydrouridine synthase DusB [uncultured Frankineae bacterium]
MSAHAGLKIGPLQVDLPVVLAPMAGVTNAAFRSLCRSYGAGLYVSEMISARALLEVNETTSRKASFGPDERVRSIQLYATNPDVVGAAVRTLVEEDGVDHVDLNVGCPSPKVTRRGGGAALPAHPVLFGRLVRSAVRAAGAVPVTVKMRKGVDDDHLTYLEAGRRAQDEGVAAVALHARTAEQFYSGRADWAAIATLKSALTTVPVLGNGDIWTADDALRMMAETGCDGVVVGRGCLGRPWLFRDLAHAFSGVPVPPAPALGEVVTVMRRHARALVEARGDEGFAVRDFRRHTGWYLTGYPVGGAARKALAMASSLAELDALLDALDPTAELPPGSEALPRGHVQGPRHVVLPEHWLRDRDDPTPPDDAGAFHSGG